jgi:hypothetical protein
MVPIESHPVGSPLRFQVNFEYIFWDFARIQKPTSERCFACFPERPEQPKEENLFKSLLFFARSWIPQKH